jgi:hypothetical protein
MKRLYMLALVAMTLPSCSSIFEGRTQELEIASTPSRAQCQVIQGSVNVGQVTTPDAITVDKSGKDIIVECEKAGYQKASVVHKSETSSWTYGNAATLGLGWGVDAISGAANKYEPRVEVQLQQAAAGSSRLGPVAGTSPSSKSSIGSQGFPPLGTASSRPNYPPPDNAPSSRAPREPVAKAASPPTPPAGAKGFGVLFASYESVGQAQTGWQNVWNRHWSVLSNVTPYIEYGRVGNGTNRFNLYGKTASIGDATQLCKTLRQRGAKCTTVYF